MGFCNIFSEEPASTFSDLTNNMKKSLQKSQCSAKDKYKAFIILQRMIEIKKGLRGVAGRGSVAGRGLQPRPKHSLSVVGKHPGRVPLPDGVANPVRREILFRREILA
ncbi:MAG: hypothetical protein DRI57_06955 [Deltaproteobacteria bacterium]|nr:MAG: hypothetical protein DRI57_06955 [Deltaproteobacteria bacterium]